MFRGRASELRTRTTSRAESCKKRTTQSHPRSLSKGSTTSHHPSDSSFNIGTRATSKCSRLQRTSKPMSSSSKSRCRLKVSWIGHRPCPLKVSASTQPNSISRGGVGHGTSSGPLWLREAGLALVGKKTALFRKFCRLRRNPLWKLGSLFPTGCSNGLPILKSD